MVSVRICVTAAPLLAPGEPASADGAQGARPAVLPERHVPSAASAAGWRSDRARRGDRSRSTGQPPPLMGWAYELFGPNRVVWGGDYPPVAGRPRVLRDRASLKHQRAAPEPLVARRAMFAANALRLFPL